MTKPVRGKTMEIASADAGEREWIYQQLQDSAVYEPLGLNAPPPRIQFDAQCLRIVRGEERRDEFVRLHIFRDLMGRLPLGFVVDFGWEGPHDSVREIDVALPLKDARNLLRYFDANILIPQFLFKNGLAKRMRWRVEGHGEDPPRRSQRQSGRLLLRQSEQHPVSGEWRTTWIYEFTKHDFEEIGEAYGFDPYRDHGELEISVWDVLGRRMRDPSRR